jgi:hypothetical protein
VESGKYKTYLVCFRVSTKFLKTTINDLKREVEWNSVKYSIKMRAESGGKSNQKTLQ